ncbi:MAG: hypothetical protein ACHQ6U_01585 [Thermodesulfobacteriota bacterium]
MSKYKICKEKRIKEGNKGINVRCEFLDSNFFDGKTRAREIKNAGLSIHARNGKSPSRNVDCVSNIDVNQVPIEKQNRKNILLDMSLGFKK